MQDNTEDRRFAKRWVNLAEQRLGTKVLFANDEFFASKDNLIKPGRAIFVADKFVETGKWMDGWETRRRRQPGHDLAWLRLGLSGRIRGFDIDTHHFNGNQPSHASVDAACLSGDPDDQTNWTQILDKQALGPSSQHLFEVDDAFRDDVQRYTHVRLNIFPDGGVARFRVFGDVMCDWSAIEPDRLIDLVAVQHEGKVLECSDMHFGHKDNLIAPGRGINMGDGWETKRRRGPGHDWVNLALGKRGRIDYIVVDTAYFRGNYPDQCSIEAADLGDDKALSLDDPNVWTSLLEPAKLQADREHVFEIDPALSQRPFTHVRLRIYPDGGVSRLRVWGRVHHV